MDINKLEYSRWILERNLHWISVIEAKTGVIVSIDTAMLGALAVAFGGLAPSERSAWAIVAGLCAALPLAVAIGYGALAVWPQIKGPPKSFIFFGKIKKRSVEEYRDDFMGASNESLLDDCLQQIHRNAEIACEKYDRVTSSMKLSFGALIPWVAALAVFVAAKH